MDFRFFTNTFKQKEKVMKKLARWFVALVMVLSFFITVANAAEKVVKPKSTAVRSVTKPKITPTEVPVMKEKRFSFGIGGAYGQTKSSEFKRTKSKKLGFGGLLQYDLSKRFSMETFCNYGKSSGDIKGISMIDIPVVLIFHLKNSGFRPFLGIGASFYFLSGKIEMTSSSPVPITGPSGPIILGMVYCTTKGQLSGSGISFPCQAGADVSLGRKFILKMAYQKEIKAFKANISNIQWVYDRILPTKDAPGEQEYTFSDGWGSARVCFLYRL